jgi:ABC-type nickel/cobalt efflux system permease component RcnA
MRIDSHVGGDADSQRWMYVRFVLGMMQMAGAVVSLVLLANLGVSIWSLTAVIVTSMATAVSVLLFGRGPARRRK